MLYRRNICAAIFSHFVALVIGGILFRLVEKNSLNFEEYQNNGIRSNIDDERGNVGFVIPTVPTNEAADVEEILEITRSRIRAELQHYNFSSSGVRRLEDLVLESRGKPLRTVIITSWRSGSTFLGEIVNAMPANFYHYEPLRNYEIQQIRGPPHAEKATRMIKSMLRCNYDNKEDLEDFFEYKKTHMQQFRHNTRMWEYCKQKKELCFDADFTTKFCKLFPFQSMKLVRFRLHLVDELLRDKNLNVKIVLLVRDPRGVLQSRHHHTFCPPAPDCWDPELVCSDMVSDYMAATKMLQQYPGRLIVLRYEDLVLKPKEMSYKLYNSLGLSVMPALDEFLESHTKTDLNCMTSTYRVSKDNAFKWKDLLDFNYTNTIQMSCKQAMRLWGYRMADNATHMQSKEFYPLGNYTIRRFQGLFIPYR